MTVPQYKVIHGVIDHDLHRVLNLWAAQGWVLSHIVRGPGSWSLIMGPKLVEVPEKKP